MVKDKALLKKLTASIAQDQPFFSFEFFPPKTEEGTLNLYDRAERMRLLGPAWVDITWGAGGSSSHKTMAICETLVQRGFDVMMHLTCTNVSRDSLFQVLQRAKEIGVCSILALRGDPPLKDFYEGEPEFFHAVDLVRFITEHFPNTFTIAVAGYPEGHHSSNSFDDDIAHLKEKVDAGADLIITQLCYDVGMFEMFLRECKEAGIQCPVVAGLMPIDNFERFERITHLTQVIVPEDLIRRLHPIKGNEEAVKELGITYLCEMMQRLLESKACLGFHFYTLNLEKSVTKILHRMNLTQSSITPKSEEKVPIPTEPYMTKGKSEWDDFPNERWGDERSPAFGNLINEVWYSSLENVQVGKEVIERSYSIQSEEDVFSIFVDFCQGNLPALPWVPEPLSAESSAILTELVNVNKKGFLTINSQPAVNGVSSSHKTHGWGGDHGFVYQKAYLEFFCRKSHWEKLHALLQGNRFPSITYLASSAAGETISHPLKQRNVLTWGMFPGREIIQTTFVGEDSFNIWKKEAFSIWEKGWITKLNPQTGQKAISILRGMMDGYMLVNVVDNDLNNGNLFALLLELEL